MNRIAKVVSLLAVLLLLLVPSVAQDDVPAGSGEGGVIFLSDGADPGTFNPLLGGDVTSSNIYNRIYPVLFGVDLRDGTYSPGFAGSLATSWEYDETGTILTVNLRQDAFWTDGTPITAHDYVWFADALRSGLLETPRSTQMFETLDDGTEGSGAVTDVVALDDYTLEFTFNVASCTSQGDILGYVMPSHILEADFGDDLAAMNDDPLYYPGVTWGVWTDPDLQAGDRVSLQADFSYPDTQLGYVNPSELVILNLPNSDIELERFLAGELTILGLPGDRQAEIEADPNFQTYRYESAGYQFFAFNHANPANPQNGLDENGEVIIQDPHPVLGNKLVRQAIVMSIDVDAIIENSHGGNAVRVGIPSIPASWDWNPDLLYPFDPATAMEMLEEAGWVDTDGNGFRECVSCDYMQIDPAYEGTEAAIGLNSFDGYGENINQMIEFIGQSIRDIGINATVNYMDWTGAFIPNLDGQTFDMAILAWSLGVPLDPDNRDIFSVTEDVPGAGFNFGSFYNAELEQLYTDGVDPAKTDGCTTEGRKPFYDRANEIMFDELPYIFLYARQNVTGAQGSLENWDPATFSRTWQEDAWDTGQ